MKIFLSFIAVTALAQAVQAQAQSIGDELPQVFTVSPTGVDMRSGELIVQGDDLSISGETFKRGGPGRKLRRQSSNDSILHNFNIGVRVSSPSNTYIANIFTENTSYQFWLLSDYSWRPANAEAVGTDLVLSGSTFSFIDAGGGFYQFQTHPALQNSPYPNGFQVLQYYVAPNGERIAHTYDTAGRLQTRQYSRGFGFRFEYDAAGNLSMICGRNLAFVHGNLDVPCGVSDRSVTYQHSLFSGKYRLSGVTYADGTSRSFHYWDNASFELLRCASLPNSTQCEIENWYGPQPGESTALTNPNQVRRQRFATGEEWTYRFNTNMLYENPQQPGEVRETFGTMIDPTGHQVHVTHGNGLLTEINGLTGANKFKYNGFLIQEYTFPEGNSVHLVYDRNKIIRRTSNPKPGSGEAPIVQTATYPLTRYDPPNNFLRPVGCVAASQKLCDKPITITDGRGHVTDYTYDPAHGGVLTETGPAAANGVRHSKRYSYVQRHAWIRSAGGGYVQAATPIWLLNDERHCRNSAPSGSGCAAPSDLVVTSYEYENGNASTPSNLLLKGVAVTADGQTLRTCYGYDQWGQRISETRPLAGLGACP